MVSQLSARLLGSRISGYTSSGSDSSSKCASSGQGTHGPHAPSSSMGGSSGYAADGSASPALPDSINFLEHGTNEATKRPHVVSSSSSSSSSLQPALKRLRTAYSLAELDHIALNAKIDIERGGLLYPKLQPNRPRMFPPKSGVNMSTVSLLSSSNFISPFLSDHKNSTAKNAGLFSHYMESPYELASLLQTTASYYSLATESEELPQAFLDVVEKLQQCTEQPPGLQENERESSSDSESSTSSFTVSDTGNHKVHHDVDSDRPDHHPSSDLIKDTAPRKSTGIIPIGEALSICRRPRIITLSQAPYNVVQVNAAFLRLSHSKSTTDFLGKPLQDLLVDDTIPRALQQSLTSMQKVTILPESSSQPFLRTPGRRSSVARISMTPVGTLPTAASHKKRITHFAIKFCEPRSSSASTSSSISSASSLSSHRVTEDTAVSVMG